MKLTKDEIMKDKKIETKKVVCGFCGREKLVVGEICICELRKSGEIY